MGEIEKILPTMLEAVRGLEVEIVIPAAHERAEKAIRRILDRAGVTTVRLQRGGARELLQRATCAVVASGTATLEAALARCPTVLVYRCDWFMATFLRFAIKAIRHVGLANIIWEKCDPAAADKSKMGPMPELLQENFTAPAVRRYLDAWLNDPAERAKAIAGLDAAMAHLQSEGDPLTHVVEELVPQAVGVG